jgi:hypothetical protein
MSWRGLAGLLGFWRLCRAGLRPPISAPLLTGPLRVPVLSRLLSSTPFALRAGLLAGSWRLVLTALVLLPKPVPPDGGFLEELRHRLQTLAKSHNQRSSCHEAIDHGLRQPRPQQQDASLRPRFTQLVVSGDLASQSSGSAFTTREPNTGVTLPGTSRYLNLLA